MKRHAPLVEVEPRRGWTDRTDWRNWDEAPQLLAAIDYIYDRAQRFGANGVVICFADGGWPGLHDGSSSLERKIEAIVSQGANGAGPPAVFVAGTGFEWRPRCFVCNDFAGGGHLDFIGGSMPVRQRLLFWSCRSAPPTDLPPKWHWPTRPAQAASGRLRLGSKRCPVQRCRSLSADGCRVSSVTRSWTGVRGPAPACVASATLSSLNGQGRRRANALAGAPETQQALRIAVAIDDGGQSQLDCRSARSGAAVSLRPSPWTRGVVSAVQSLTPDPGVALRLPAGAIAGAQSKTSGFIVSEDDAGATGFAAGALALAIEEALRRGSRRLGGSELAGEVFSEASQETCGNVAGAPDLTQVEAPALRSNAMK